jgi:urea transport system permease protein
MPSASGATYRGRDARAPLGCVAWCVLGIFAFSWGAHAAAAEEKPAREIITQAILVTNQAEKRKLITSLEGRGDDVIVTLFDAWRADELFVYTPQDGEKTPIQLAGAPDANGAREALRVLDGSPLSDAASQPMRLAPTSPGLAPVTHTTALRRTMKGVLDLIELASPDLARRVRAIQMVGFAQDATKLPLLEARRELEQDAAALAALREAIALVRLKSPSQDARVEALVQLKEIHSLASTDFLRNTLREAEEKGETRVATAARSAIVAVESHRSTVNFWGTLFRGVSLGSILLVVALGLAITFGLMRVINMAHGEMIAVGAYTTYIVQNIFAGGLALSPFGFSFAIPGINATGWLAGSYFIFALPLSFLAAALVGIALERGVIRFLYQRPLESLLATWGVSLVLQQLFRLIFGANNVQVSSPAWLSGNWTFHDIIFGWNRIFVIGFAALIVIGTWLILTRTPLGLLIRAVMQNRPMAACMGVRTERVNMLTFGLGSGLAGLAGAFLSQIGNVGPSLGQSYIVDCFMTVVVGGIGSIAGTVVSAFGIGITDQALQQILLNPVLGKILVLVAIILFLQWRPAGLFVTRSRNLDD